MLIKRWQYQKNSIVLQKSETFLPLMVKKVKLPFQQKCKGDAFAISKNKQYICLIEEDEQYNYQGETPRLYNFITQQLIKTFQKIKQPQQTNCYFSDNSKILIISEVYFSIIYLIQQNKLIRRERVPQIQFSFDSSKYLFDAQYEILIYNQPFEGKKISFLNSTKNYNWQFSGQANNFLISLQNNSDTRENYLQYFFIKNNKFQKVLEIVRPKTNNLEYGCKISEFFENRLIIINTEAQITIYNLRKKLIRKLNREWTERQIEAIEMRKDIYEKPTLVITSSSYGFCPTIVFTSILPEIKIQKFNFYERTNISQTYSYASLKQNQYNEVEISYIE